VAVFLERFVLSVCAAALMGLLVVNPFNLNAHQRWSAALVVVGLAYFTAATATRIRSPNVAAAHEGIVLEWSQPPYPTYVSLTNKTPDALLNVDGTIVDIKRKVDGVFAHTWDWLPPRGPIPLEGTLGPGVVFHNESLQFEVLRGDMTDPYVWHVGRGDVTVSSGEWEITIKCTWRDQPVPLMKKFRFRFVERGRPQILP
jgi:hypothetical protein